MARNVQYGKSREELARMLKETAQMAAVPNEEMIGLQTTAGQLDNMSDGYQVKAEPIGRVGKIGKKEIQEAARILEKYKAGKKNLEKRLIENESFWKMMYWEQVIGKNDKKEPEEKKQTLPTSTSAWLFNSIINKHADAMDNYPEPSALAREETDKEYAEMLSSILPVVFEQADFEQTYNDAWWYKLIKGTGAYAVFWNTKKNYGLGDVDIKQIDLLNLFWEPGKKDIQKSKNVFHLELVDNDILESQYDFLKGRLDGRAFEVSEYIYDDTVDNSEKSIVVDWYYKVYNGTRDVLHYCKFVNDEVLYASENDEDYMENGYYNHGKYPFVLDVLFPEEGTPTGFGVIDAEKKCQMYIDSLDGEILKNAKMASRPRYFMKESAGINENDLADWEKQIVKVAGNDLDGNVKEIPFQGLEGIYVTILNNKIEELKETSGNRDFSQGASAAGVTAASAIAALQEAGSKLSRDQIKSAYRAHKKIVELVVELIRQFYDEPRCFRITGHMQDKEFVHFDNSHIKPVKQGVEHGVDLGYRMPIFDIKIKSHKASPFSKLAQNELAKELYGLGLFQPGNADQALAVLEMMDFEGRETVIKRVQENGTMYQQLQQMQMQMQKLATIVDAQNGTTIGAQMQTEAPVEERNKVKGEVSSTKTEVNPLGEAYQSAKKNTADVAKERAMSAATPR